MASSTYCLQVSCSFVFWSAGACAGGTQTCMCVILGGCGLGSLRSVGMESCASYWILKGTFQGKMTPERLWFHSKTTCFHHKSSLALVDIYSCSGPGHIIYHPEKDCSPNTVTASVTAICRCCCAFVKVMMPPNSKLHIQTSLAKERGSAGLSKPQRGWALDSSSLAK